eukprot:gene21524-21471_t
MRLSRFRLLPLLLALSWQAHAQTAQLDLWPEGVPNYRANAGAEHHEGERINNISHPSLTVYPASVDRPAHTAVII